MSERKFVDVTPIIGDFKIRGAELNGCDPVVYGIHKGFAEAAKLLSKAITADVAPVVRAEWISMERPHSAKDVCKCSNCGVVVTPYEFWHYCPACGAEMESGKE